MILDTIYLEKFLNNSFFFFPPFQKLRYKKYYNVMLFKNEKKR